jgi:pyruvate/2-oxoglutarate dehydrogenase complex dihydrolipoamide acyltransferase (E2) component
VRVTVKLPRLGMQMEEATIVRYCVAAGESFRAGDPLYEIETDKVESEIEATADGVMVEHLVAEGDDVEVGAPICILDTT